MNKTTEKTTKKKGLVEETKKVVVGARGGKTTSRQTITKLNKSKEKKAELNKPIGFRGNTKTYIVQGNLNRNGKKYKKGDEIETLLSKEIQILIDIKALKLKNDIQ